MRVLVTGGAGFIGHHLVRSLLERGDDVVVLDDLSTGSLHRLEPFRGRFTFIQGSVLDPADVELATADREVILHEAAIPSVARSIANPLATNEANATGSIVLMQAAIKQGVKRVVVAGSSSVYGVPETLPCRETMRAAPESPYGASKLAAEHYIQTLGRLHGVETVVLRYFNVFGPGQDPASEYAAVVPKFVTAVLAGTPPTVNGTGEVSRDFTYIDNVVRANLLAAVVPGASGLTCNVACGTRYTLLELLQAIWDAVGHEVRPVFAAARAGDILHSQADISRARASLGYEPVVPFGEGIARTVAWYREQTSSASQGASDRSPRPA